jgi:hypothetical protein
MYPRKLRNIPACKILVRVTRYILRYAGVFDGISHLRGEEVTSKAMKGILKGMEPLKIL